MGDKVHTLVIKVDLHCWRCKQKIHDYLCCIQNKEHIVEIKYDEKNNVVRVSGPFDAEQLKKKLLCDCKLRKIIISIEIEPPKKEEKKDEKKEKFMKKCEEEYAEITKCIEKCKKECEEKCMKEWEDRFKCKCKDKCKDKCKCSCDCKKKEDPPKCKCKSKCSCDCKPEKPKEEPKPKPPVPVCPPQVTAICCARPCPCFVPWSKNYQCCSCGVVAWPGSCGPGWGTGPGHGVRPQWACEPSRPQWGCEPSRPHRVCEPPNIVLESSPNCAVM